MNTAIAISAAAAFLAGLTAFYLLFKYSLNLSQRFMLVFSLFPLPLLADSLAPINCNVDEVAAFIVEYDKIEESTMLAAMGFNEPEIRGRQTVIVTAKRRVTAFRGEKVDETALFGKEKLTYKPFRWTEWEEESQVYTHNETEEIATVRKVTPGDRSRSPFSLPDEENQKRVAGLPCTPFEKKLPGYGVASGCDAKLYGWRTPLFTIMKAADADIYIVEAESYHHECIKEARIAVPEDLPWKE